DEVLGGNVELGGRITELLPVRSAVDREHRRGGAARSQSGPVEGETVLLVGRSGFRVSRVRTGGGVEDSTGVLAEFGHQRPGAGGPDGDVPGFAAGDRDRRVACPAGVVAGIVDALP